MPDFQARDWGLEASCNRNKIDFRSTEFLRATNSLLRRYQQVYQLAAQLVGMGDTPTHGVPIGSTVARVLANLALSSLDDELADRSDTICYRRYVDDFVLVSRCGSESPSKSTFAESVAQLIPSSMHDPGGGEIRVENEFGKHILNQDKSMLHRLEGPSALAFLDAVSESFSAASVERSLFLIEGTKAVSDLKFQRTSRKSGTGDGPPKLREADDLSVERYAARTLLMQLSAILVMLGRSPEATSEVSDALRRFFETVRQGHDFDDLEITIYAYRVAVISGHRESSKLILELIRSIVDSATEAPLFWGVHECRPKASLAAMRDFLRDQLTQARSMCQDPRRSPSAASFYFAGIRHLSWADDRELFGELSPPERPAYSRALARVRRSLWLRTWYNAYQTFCSLRGRDSDSDILMSILDPRGIFFDDVFDAMSDDVFSGADDSMTVTDALDVCDLISGTRSERVSTAAVVPVADRVVRLDLTGESSRGCRTYVVSFPADEKSLIRSMSSPTSPSKATVEAIRKAFEAMDLSSWTGDAKLAVFPELSIPRGARRRIHQKAKRRGISVVYGLEYSRDLATGRLLNVAEGYFPITPFHWGAIRWYKSHPARIESDHGVRYPAWVARRPKVVVAGSFGRLGVLICSELLDPDLLSLLRSKIELLAVPAWNKDVDTYDILTRSVSEALVHTYVALANCSEASDARILAPVREPRHLRSLCRVVLRGGETAVVWGELPLRELKAFHRGRSKPNDVEFRPLPPRWPKPSAHDQSPAATFARLMQKFRRAEVRRRDLTEDRTPK